MYELKQNIDCKLIFFYVTTIDKSETMERGCFWKKNLYDK